jgi:ERCC4-type nuclease
VYQAGRRPKSRHRRQLRLLQDSPGIGPGKSVKLLETFGTVAAVMAADQEQLRQVDGIGEKTAAAIHDILHETLPPSK